MIKILGKEFPFPTPEEAQKSRLPWGLQLIKILVFIAKKLIPYDEENKVLTVNKVNLKDKALSVRDGKLALNDTPITKSLSDRIDTELGNISKSFSDVENINHKQAKDIKALETAIKQLQSSKSSLLPIGTVLQAFMGEAEFQKQYGPGWVLCDGRSVAGSLYASMFASKIPDCRGRFLRSHGPGSVNIGEHQSDETAANSLRNSSSSVSGGRISGSINPVTLRTISTSPQAKFTYYYEPWKYKGSNYSERAFGASIPTANKKSGSSVGEFEDGHQHNIRPHSHTHSLTISGTRTAAAQTITGGIETRPKNIAIHTFIRIN